VDLDGGFVEAALAALTFSLLFAGWAGTVKGIDPGRPGVPEFGRRLFRLPIGRPKNLVRRTQDAVDTLAIERKTGVPIATGQAREDAEWWRNGLLHFKQRLRDSAILGAVLDYDGTIVEINGRFKPPATAVTNELIRLLDAGVVLGVATGRGKSVKADLRAVIPQSLWSQLIVGYYNGAEVGDLSDESRPDLQASVRPELVGVMSGIRTDQELRAISKCTSRPSQITLETKGHATQLRLWDIANRLVQAHGSNGVSVVCSSHSVDILAAGVSKLAVVNAVSSRINDDQHQRILTIGDRGCWPGNDFALLRTPLSLSADEVSSDVQTCWNLATKGQRGPTVTCDYLRRLKTNGSAGGCHFEI
jgi:hypothetical protein